MLSLVPAKISDQLLVYQWLYFADSSQLLIQLEGIQPKDIPSFTDFTTDFEDYFFDGTEPYAGRSYMMQLDNFEHAIGCIHYTAFHLLPKIAELDMWMVGERFCSKGYGTTAINLISKILSELGFQQIMIRPSKENIRAIKAYQKAGFKKEILQIEKYYKKEYYEAYGSGDYGWNNDVFMVKHL